MTALSLLLLTLAAGCASSQPLQPDGGRQQQADGGTCEDKLDRIAGDLLALTPKYSHSCSSVDECALVFPQTTCVTLCAQAVLASLKDTYVTAVASAGSQDCKLACAHVVYDCAPTTLSCEAGVCTQR